MSGLQQRLDDRRAKLDRIAAMRQQTGLTLEGRPFRLRFNGLTGRWAYSLTLESGIQVSGIDFETDEAARSAARAFLAELKTDQRQLATVDVLALQAMHDRLAAERAAGTLVSAASVKPVPVEKPKPKPVPLPAPPPPCGKKMKHRCSRCQSWHERTKRTGQGSETRRYCFGCYDIEMADRRALANEQKELGYSK